MEEFKKAIKFQDNCEREEDGEDEDEVIEANPPTKLWKNENKIKFNEKKKIARV